MLGRAVPGMSSSRWDRMDLRAPASGAADKFPAVCGAGSLGKDAFVFIVIRVPKRRTLCSGTIAVNSIAHTAGPCNGCRGVAGGVCFCLLIIMLASCGNFFFVEVIAYGTSYLAYAVLYASGLCLDGAVARCMGGRYGLIICFLAF